MNVAGIVKGTSKMLTALTTYSVWVMQSSLADIEKAKYLAAPLVAYFLMQGGKDMVKSWKGRKASTGSNADEAA